MIEMVLGIALAALVLGSIFYIFKSQQTRLREEFARMEQNSSTLRQEFLKELQSNRMELQNGLNQTSDSLQKKVGGLDERLQQQLADMNKGVQSKLETQMKEGFVHFEKVQQHLHTAGKQLENLNNVGESINDLNRLLKLPHLRGNFGEAVLERLLSDLLPAHCFELQYRIVPGSTERVDAVIRYPNQVLPIDSKFPREQILPLFETNDPIELESARKTLGEIMKGLGRQISEKYIHPEHGTSDMALLFVPSETIYFEILRNMKLCEELAKLKIFTVSPNTLAVTLHSISIAREYYEMAKGVESTVEEIKKAQKHFENFEERFDEVGKSLKRAQDCFDKAGTHLNRYQSAVQRLPEATIHPVIEAPRDNPKPQLTT